MTKNMGSADRIIRITLAAVVMILFATKTISGTFGIVLLVLAGVFVLTGSVGFCPVYKMFGFNTCPASKK